MRNALNMMIDMKSNKHNTNDASKQNSNNDNLKGTMDMESDVNIHVQDIPTERRNELKIMYANVFNTELPSCTIHNRIDGNGWHHVDIDHPIDKDNRIEIIYGFKTNQGFGSEPDVIKVGKTYLSADDFTANSPFVFMDSFGIKHVDVEKLYDDGRDSNGFITGGHGLNANNTKLKNAQIIKTAFDRNNLTAAQTGAIERIYEETGQLIADCTILFAYIILFKNNDGSFMSCDDKYVHKVMTADYIGIHDDRLFDKYMAKQSGKSEWFQLTDNTLDAVECMKSIIKSIMNGSENDRIPKTTIIPRIRQMEAADSIINVLNENNKYNVNKSVSAVNQPVRTFLLDCIMRFGKTITTYAVMNALKPARVLILSHRTNTLDNWKHDAGACGLGRYFHDTRVIADGSNDYNEFITSYENAMPDEPCYAYATIQKLSNDSELSQFIKTHAWDKYVIDESHEGIETDNTHGIMKSLMTAVNGNGYSMDILKITGTAYTTNLKGTAADYPDDADTAIEYLHKDNVYKYNLFDELSDRKRASNGDKDFQYILALPMIHFIHYMPVNGNNGNILDAMPLSALFNTVINNANQDVFTKNIAVNELLSQLFETSVINGRAERSIFKSQSHPEWREASRHSLWVLPSVGACRAMKQMLVDNGYVNNADNVIIAAGDGTNSNDSLDKVRERIRIANDSNENTITLTFNQLLVGTTVPEWGSVLMMTGTDSAIRYMQSAFRAKSAMTGKRHCYVFDFDKNRMLSTLYDAFSGETDGDGSPIKDNFNEMFNLLDISEINETGAFQKINVDDAFNFITRDSADKAFNHAGAYMKLFDMDALNAIMKSNPDYWNAITSMPSMKLKDNTSTKQEFKKQSLFDTQNEHAQSDDITGTQCSTISNDDASMQSNDDMDSTDDNEHTVETTANDKSNANNNDNPDDSQDDEQEQSDEYNDDKLNTPDDSSDKNRKKDDDKIDVNRFAFLTVNLPRAMMMTALMRLSLENNGFTDSMITEAGYAGWTDVNSTDYPTDDTIWMGMPVSLRRMFMKSAGILHDLNNETGLNEFIASIYKNATTSMFNGWLIQEWNAIRSIINDTMQSNGNIDEFMQSIMNWSDRLADSSSKMVKTPASTVNNHLTVTIGGWDWMNVLNNDSIHPMRTTPADNVHINWNGRMMDVSCKDGVYGLMIAYDIMRMSMNADDSLWIGIISDSDWMHAACNVDIQAVNDWFGLYGRLLLDAFNIINGNHVDYVETDVINRKWFTLNANTAKMITNVKNKALFGDYERIAFMRYAYSHDYVDIANMLDAWCQPVNNDSSPHEIMHAIDSMVNGKSCILDEMEIQSIVDYIMYALDSNDMNAWNRAVNAVQIDIIDSMKRTTSRNKKIAEQSLEHIINRLEIIQSKNENNDSNERNADMFALIVGNPPYNTKEHGKTENLYQFFYLASREIARIVDMVFMVGWRTSSMHGSASIGHDKIREDNSIIMVDDYPSNEMFPGAGLPDKVNIVVRDDSYDNNGLISIFENGLFKEKKNLIINDPHIIGIDRSIIIDKISTHWNGKFESDNFTGINPFMTSGYLTTDKSRIGYNEITNYNDGKSFKCWMRNKNNNDYNWWFIPKDLMVPNPFDKNKKCNAFIDRNGILDSYKVIVPKSGQNRVHRDAGILYPGEGCCDTFICHAFDTIDECHGFISYMRTLFFRYIIDKTAKDQNAYSILYRYVPDLSETVNPRTGKTGYDSDWTDDDLKTVFAGILTDDDWIYIKSHVPDCPPARNIMKPVGR